MARDYVLKESAAQRQALIEAVTLSALQFASNVGGDGVIVRIGIELSNDDYRHQLLEKLQAGIPFEEIAAFPVWLREMERSLTEAEQENAHWRALASYRKSIECSADQLFGDTSPPSVAECESLGRVLIICSSEFAMGESSCERSVR